MVQGLTIRNARVWWHDGDSPHFETRNVYAAERIVESPSPHAVTVDLSGYSLFPGLVNAHDHLELNHFPRTKFRDRYDNAHQWGEDVNARLDESPFRDLRAYPLEDRLFIGGLKNVLCGATTVMHHNPPHKSLFRRSFPVSVIPHYTWSHSLHFSTSEAIQDAVSQATHGLLWFIHLAEGTDDTAAQEYRQLERLGCISGSTVFIHGVGLNAYDTADAARLVRGLVVCPSTNFYLLGRTADVNHWVEHGGRVALGSDSRLTADGDLLDEMRSAVNTGLNTRQVFDMVTDSAANLLGLDDVGLLASEAYADFIAVRSTHDDITALCSLKRSDLALVVRNGVPQVGDPDVMACFPHIETIPATLDGVPKAIHIDLARRYLSCTLKEPGLELVSLPRRQPLSRLFRRGA